MQDATAFAISALDKINKQKADKRRSKSHPKSSQKKMPPIEVDSSDEDEDDFDDQEEEKKQPVQQM